MITINWEAVSAIATSVACIIALWQTHVAYREKVKFTFHESARVVRGNEQLDAVKLDIRNVGNRIIEITGWGLLFRDDVVAIFSPPPQEWLCLGGYLPKVVEVGCSMSLYFERGSFLATIKAQCEANNIVKRDKLKVVVYAGSGECYVVKVSKRCKDFLNTSHN